jgi:hypothetical protein
MIQLASIMSFRVPLVMVSKIDRQNMAKTSNNPLSEIPTTTSLKIPYTEKNADPSQPMTQSGLSANTERTARRIGTYLDLEREEPSLFALETFFKKPSHETSSFWLKKLLFCVIGLSENPLPAIQKINNDPEPSLSKNPIVASKTFLVIDFSQKPPIVQRYLRV